MKTIKVIESKENQTFRVTLDGVDQSAILNYIDFQDKNIMHNNLTKLEAYNKCKQFAFDLATWEPKGCIIVSESF